MSVMATFLGDAAVGTLGVLAVLAIMILAREAIWALDWISDQVKERWRAR